jgi:hypothetical protein
MSVSIERFQPGQLIHLGNLETVDFVSLWINTPIITRNIAQPIKDRW